MKKNEGSLDRIVRTALGVAALAVAFTTLDVMDGAVFGIIVTAIGVALIVSAIIGFCPMYKVFGLRTCPLKSCPMNRGGACSG
jgi:hypothetical protein